MVLAEAEILADHVRKQLVPHCIRAEIAGSIRRERPEVKDIEICAIPKFEEVQDGFFDKKMVVSEGFIKQVNQWEKVKGEPTGKYTQRILPGGMRLDLFIAKTVNWGLIFAIRTGSADFSHHILISKIKKAGYQSEGGMLTQAGKIVIVKEEEKLFDMIDMEVRYYAPANREVIKLYNNRR